MEKREPGFRFLSKEEIRSMYSAGDGDALVLDFNSVPVKLPDGWTFTAGSIDAKPTIVLIDDKPVIDFNPPDGK